MMELSGTTRCCAAYEVKNIATTEFTDFVDFGSRLSSLGGTVVYATTTNEDTTINEYLREYGGVSQPFVGGLLWVIDQNPIVEKWQQTLIELQWAKVIEEEPERTVGVFLPNDVLVYRNAIGGISRGPMYVGVQRLDGVYDDVKDWIKAGGSHDSWEKQKQSTTYYYNAEYHDRPSYRRWGYLIKTPKNNCQYAPLTPSQITQYKYPQRAVL